MTTTEFVEVRSTFQRRPAYRYLRKTDRLPRIDEVRGKPLDQIVAKIRLIDPISLNSWYICAYDPNTGHAYGVAELDNLKIGTFSMAKLVAFRGWSGLPIERDVYYSANDQESVDEMIQKWRPRDFFHSADFCPQIYNRVNFWIEEPVTLAH